MPPRYRLGDLQGISREDVEQAGILSIDELSEFRPAIESKFSGKQKQVLLSVADSLERGDGVPDSAVDPGLRAREPTPGDAESIRRRLSGEEGTPSDEYNFKTEDDALHTELAAAKSTVIQNEDDALVMRPEQDFDTLTQEQVSVQGDRVEKARSYNQEERSSRARAVDRAFDAPVTTDYQRWKDNPDELDFPGVDTVPQPSRRRRASQFAADAQEQGVAENFEIGTGVFGENKVGTRGNASGSTVQVDTSRTANGAETLAHEVGHKIENVVRDRTGSVFGNEDERAAAETLSTQQRGEPDDPYRESDSELFADAVAASVLSPDRAQRDAPEFSNRLDDALDESEKDLFPDSLL